MMLRYMRTFLPLLLAVSVVGYFIVRAINDPRNQPLGPSASGVDGLRIWLEESGVPVPDHTREMRASEEAEDVGLVVVALYDTTIGRHSAAWTRGQKRDASQDKLEQWLNEVDEIPAGYYRYGKYVNSVPLLLALPKWRREMRFSGKAHPSFLINARRLQDTLLDVFPPPKQDEQAAGEGEREEAKLLRPAGEAFGSLPYTARDGQTLTVRLYQPQLFTAPDCQPIIGTQAAMLLGRCGAGDQPEKPGFFILSDPDLLNNHGLSLGDNAAVIRDFVAGQAGEKKVILTSSYLRVRLPGDYRAPSKHIRRSVADLLRFFEPPFLWFWLALGAAALLALSRSAVRFGPILSGDAPGKELSLGARARLMRLANNDGALAWSYGKARLIATASSLFGPAHGHVRGQPEAFLAYVRRQHPAHADALQDALGTLRSLPAAVAPAQAMKAATRLDNILEKITHDT